GDFFGVLYDDLNLRDRLSTLPNGDRRSLNLQYLQDRGTQFDSFRRKGLTRFLEFIDDLLERGDDLGQPAALSNDMDVVKIMTIHKSKGLEFRNVILPFMSKRFNLMDLNGKILLDHKGGFATEFREGLNYASDS